MEEAAEGRNGSERARASHLDDEDEAFFAQTCRDLRMHKVVVVDAYASRNPCQHNCTSKPIEADYVIDGFETLPDTLKECHTTPSIPKATLIQIGRQENRSNVCKISPSSNATHSATNLQSHQHY